MEKHEKDGAMVDRDYSPNGDSGNIVGTGPRPQTRRIHDPDVKFEEYQYYARLTRQAEEAQRGQAPKVTLMTVLFPSSRDSKAAPADVAIAGVSLSENNADLTAYAEHMDTSKREYRSTISDEEWVNANRAVRTASAAACFYLITTDILGPLGLPYAFATTGWGPGISLYTVFAFLAGVSGYLLWDMFMGLDSYQFPLKTYGDIAYRVYGQWVRIPMNILQSILLIASVGIIITSNGQALSVIVKFKFCYAGCLAVLVPLGYGLGQIRTLQRFGWLATVAVGINILIMFITMGVAAHSPPNYNAIFLSAGSTIGDVTQDKAGNYPPVTHHANLPVTSNFIGSVNGISQAVYAYGGAQLFVEFMAELSRPRDFLKAMWGAQFFIWFFYMLYGLFMYGYQGQYSVNPSPQTISPYGWLVAANILYICSATIAATLYGNIGFKILYNNIFVELFRLPPLSHKTGKFIWMISIPIYWSAAFALGAAIPNFNALVGLIGAACILQFTYSFPPFLHIGYLIQLNAAQDEEGFDPVTGITTRKRRGFNRIMHGYLFSGTLFQRFLKLWNVIYMLAALALAGLGIYAAVEILILLNASSTQTAFTCHSPLNMAGYAIAYGGASPTSTAAA